jgi:hypothetical protein
MYRYLQQARSLSDTGFNFNAIMQSIIMTFELFLLSGVSLSCHSPELQQQHQKLGLNPFLKHDRDLETFPLHPHTRQSCDESIVTLPSLRNDGAITSLRNQDIHYTTGFNYLLV